MEIKEMLFSFRDHYGSYHNHKEQMAYGATVLYLAGATAVVLKGNAILSPHVPRWVVCVAFVAGFLFALSFVVWQLRHRETASDIVSACTSLLTQLVADPNVSLAREPDCYRGINLPKALVDHICWRHAHPRLLLRAESLRMANIFGDSDLVNPCFGKHASKCSNRSIDKQDGHPPQADPSCETDEMR